MKKYKPETTDELKVLVNNLRVNLGDIDTSKITNMAFLFLGSERTDFNGIEDWDVSNVTVMFATFSESNFNGDISKWNVSNVVDMASMFEKSPFNGDISNWNVSSVEKMAYMFYNSQFNGDISKWVLNENVTIDEDTFEKIKGEQK